MATTTFTDQETVITADWANDVDALVYDIFGEATTDAEARTNLGVAIGSDVQAFDAALDDISGLSLTDGNIIVGDGANWVAESGNTARTSLGLGTGNSPQFTGLTLTGDLTVDTDTFVVDAANHYVHSDTIQVRNNTTPAAGAGMELKYSADTSRLHSYDRDTPGWKDLQVNASEIQLDVSGTRTMTLNASSNVSIPNGDLYVGVTSPTTARNLVVETTSETTLSIVGGATSNTQLVFGDSLSDLQGRVLYRNSSDQMELYSNGTPFLQGDSSQNVSIPNGNLTISGNLVLDTNSSQINATNSSATKGRIVDIATDTVIFGDPSNTFGDVRIDAAGGPALYADGTDGGIYTTNANGGSQGAGTINASAIYDDGVAVPSSSGTTGGTGSAGAGNQYVELTISGTTYKILHDGTV